MKLTLKSIATASVSLLVGLSMGLLINTSAQEENVYELRTYTATEGNLEKLHSRFRDHTTRIFNKHGMKVVGYWTPMSEEEAGDTLIYILEHHSQQSASASWQAFGADPEWQEVAAASNAQGPILGDIKRKYMVATDYSPMK